MAETIRVRARVSVWLLIAAINGFLAVAAGAFGAHALQGRLDAHALTVFETGARGFGIVTPFGGVAFLIGWIALAWAATRVAA